MAGGLAQRFRDRLAVEQARQIGVMQRKLDRLGVEPDLPRELLESLALRFEHANPDAPVPELVGFLKAKAAEWKELKARLAALEAEDPRIGNARAAAEAGDSSGGFRRGRRRPGRGGGAAAGASDAGRGAPAGRAAPGAGRGAAAEGRRGRRGGARRGGGGVPAALRAAGGGGGPARRGRAPRTTRAFASAAPVCCARSTSTGGTGRSGPVRRIRWTGRRRRTTSASRLATRPGGPRGRPAAALLAEAAEAYRAALDGPHAAAHPVDWATTQSNSAASLLNKPGGPRGRRAQRSSPRRWSPFARCWRSALRRRIRGVGGGAEQPRRRAGPAGWRAEGATGAALLVERWRPTGRRWRLDPGDASDGLGDDARST